MVNNLTEGKPLKLLFFFAMPMVVGPWAVPWLFPSSSGQVRYLK